MSNNQSLLSKARKLEQLLDEAYQLGDETGFVSRTFLASLQVMARNVSKHYHNHKNTQQGDKE